jgi:hypothetical protein
VGYLGNNLQAAYSSYLLIDSLTASFNGTTTSFPLRVNGITPVPFPVNEQNVLISVGGVPQKPDPTGAEGFRFSGSNIVFSSAPKTGEAFWGVVLAGADYINVGADFPDGSASAPSITFASEKSTGFYKVSSGTVGVALNGSLGPLFTGSGVYLNNTNNGLYSPGTNQLALSTAGTGRLFVDASGNVGIGTASPGTSRTYIQCNDTNTAGLTISGINSSTGVSTFSTLKLIGATPNNLGAATHYGVEFVKTQSNLESITGYYADVNGIYNTQTNFHAKLTKNLGASTNGYCYYADLSTSSSGGLAYFHYCYNSTSTALRFSVQDSGQVVINSAASTAPFIARVNNAESLRIDSSGRLLVGTSSAISNVARFGTDFTPGAQFVTNTASWNTGLGLINYATGGFAPALTFGLSGSATIGTNALVSSGNRLGVISFNGNDGTNFEEAARIEAFVDGTPGANDMPGRLVFFTTADGAATPTERVRIDSSGRLLVGTTSTSGFQTGVYHVLLNGSGTVYGSISVGTIPVSGNATDLNLTSWTASGANFFTSRIRQAGDGSLQISTQSTVSSDGAGTVTERMRLDASTGNLLVGTTTTTANGGVLQVSNGVTFPATQVACTDVNTLDDYEEGTWTPAIAGTTLAGAGTYSVQVGRYTKIGNTVTVHLNLTWSAHTGTGNMTISGLPFTSANVTNLNPTTVAYANNLTITGIPVVLVTANATTGTINSVNNGTAAALAMDTAATFTATITYQTA